MKISLESFNNLTEKELVHGAEVYKFSANRESTDELFDVFGSIWLFGNCNSYVLNFVNTQEEKQLFNISYFCFIIWLKRGFHLSATGLIKPVDTSLELKKQNYQDFIIMVCNYYEKNEFYFNNLLEVDALSKISNLFKCFSYNNWEDVTEEKLIHIYCLSYVIWNFHFYKKIN